MERSQSKLSKFVRRVIRPLTGCETRGAVHASPVKSRAKNWASKSLRILTGAFLASNVVKDDDASSFMSPMPDELYSPPSGDQCPSPPSHSKDASDLSSEGCDSVRLSFILCADIIDLFPAPPAISTSQTMHLQHSQLSRPLMLTPPPRDYFQIYGTFHRRDDTSCRASEGIIRRNSMSFSLLPSLIMPSQFSAHSMPFDMLTRTHYPHSDSSPSSCESDFNGSPPGSYPISSGLVSTQNSQQSLGSPFSLSSSFTIPSRPNTPLSNYLIPIQSSTDVSLQDLRESRPSLSSSPPSPSSFRSATSRVPGLEHRTPGSLRRRLNPIHDSANPDEGHVPYGTIQF